MVSAENIAGETSVSPKDREKLIQLSVLCIKTNLYANLKVNRTCLTIPTQVVNW
jgi:hypothetical protein